MSFLESADPERCNTLWSSLRKKSVTGAGHYPIILTDSFNFLSHYRPPVTRTTPQDGVESSESQIYSSPR